MAQQLPQRSLLKNRTAGIRRNFRLAERANREDIKEYIKFKAAAGFPVAVFNLFWFLEILLTSKTYCSIVCL